MSKNIYVREGIYWARFTVAGVEYRQSLRTRSERVAEKRMKALRESIEDQAVYGMTGPVSWPAVVVSWNESIGDALAPRTFRRYASSLRQMRGFLDHLDVQTITAEVLRDMIKVRKRAGVKNATIRRDLTALSSVLNHAEDEGMIERNPVLEVNRRRIVPEKIIKIVLPQDDMIALMFPKLPERIRDMCEFTRETGLRLDEVCGLRHANLDRTARLITIVGKRSKVRTVPLTALAEQIIDRQPRYIGKPFVFWKGQGEQFRDVSSRIGGYMQRSAQKAAQEKREFHAFSHHGFRHLYAVEFLRDGRGSIYELQGLLGHDSITTTERYLAFLTPEQAMAARNGTSQNAAQEQRSETT